MAEQAIDTERKILRVLQTREASKVKRCHLIPHQGEYTVGQHSFDAAMLLVTLWPEPVVPSSLLLWILTHDLAERWTGDVPSPTRRNHPEIERKLSELESKINSYFCWCPALSLLEQKWATAIDRLELWLWAHDQVAMGNRVPEGFIPYLQEWAIDAEAPTEILTFMENYKWRRTNSVAWVQCLQ